MSHHKDGHSDHPGEQEGFLDKVKDFFTGGDDRENRSDATEQEGVVEQRDELAREGDDLAEGQGETDSVASAGSGGAGVSESGWDGSDEPPELTVPENEAVAAYSDASEGDDGVAASSGDIAPGGETEPLEDTGNAAVANYSDASDDDAAGATAESAETASGPTSEVTSAEDDEDYESRHGSGVDDSGVLADAPIEDDAGGDDAAARAEEEERARREEEEERARREEEFAREHDPSTHDVEAGEEFRQRGDWTAAEHDGPQVQEADGTVHDPDDDADSMSDDSVSGDSVSGADDIQDGGHGWGSAAPMPGGGTPLGHPVKAWHDTMTFVLPGEDGYEGSDPHEWFVDAETAQRAGFRHAHGG